MMHWVPSPYIIAGCGLLPLAALLLLPKSNRLIVLIIAAAIVVCMIWKEPLTLRYSKYFIEPEKVLFEKWTPTARITIYPNSEHFQSDPTASFVWGWGSKFIPVPIEQLWLEQDGGAGTPITRLKGSPKELEHLFFDVTSVGYQLRTADSVCVIGSGGGRDILTALKAHAKSIDAVELNGTIIDALTGPFLEFSGNLYKLPEVNPIVSEGRSYLTYHKGAYDMIQISLIDTWAATTAGAYALSENYLYTKEAFLLYWKNLSAKGMLSVSRWFFGSRQLEGARLVVLARAVLHDMGIPNPEKHIAVIQGHQVATMLVSKQPFNNNEIFRLKQINEERGFVQHWPITQDAPKMSTITQLLSANVDYTAFPKWMDMNPPTDDQPFFFQTIKLFRHIDRETAKRLSVNDNSVILLRRLLILVSILTICLFFSPFIIAKKYMRKKPGFWRGSGYFACIGMAFMLVEAAWLQRYILYLGHPSYSTTIVLASLLLGAGTGSFTATKIRLSKIQIMSPLLPLVIAFVNIILASLFVSTIGWAFAVRVIFSVLLTLSSGFFMGFAFPTGMIRFGDGNKAWFWAINGAAGVLATIFSLAISMTIGIINTVFLGVLVYFIAAILMKGKVAEPPFEEP